MLYHKRKKMQTPHTHLDCSWWGKEQNHLVEVAPEEVASENKLKDKKVIAVFHKEALSNCASPTTCSGFSEVHPFILEAGHHGEVYPGPLGSCPRGADWPRTTWAAIRDSHHCAVRASQHPLTHLLSYSRWFSSFCH